MANSAVVTLNVGVLLRLSGLDVLDVDIPENLIVQLNQVSADYILDHPEEFLTQTFNAQNLGAFRDMVKILADDTNVLMLYAAISSDLDVINPQFADTPFDDMKENLLHLLGHELYAEL